MRCTSHVRLKCPNTATIFKLGYRIEWDGNTSNLLVHHCDACAKYHNFWDDYLRKGLATRDPQVFLEWRLKEEL